MYTHLKVEDAQCEMERLKMAEKNGDEYELSLYFDLYSFYLPRYGKICDFMLG